MDEWNTLSAERQAALLPLIQRARTEGGTISDMHQGDEIYAYRHPTGRVAWGVNSGVTGMNVKRGIKE